MAVFAEHRLTGRMVLFYVPDCSDFPPRRVLGSTTAFYTFLYSLVVPENLHALVPLFGGLCSCLPVCL